MASNAGSQLACECHARSKQSVQPCPHLHAEPVEADLQLGSACCTAGFLRLLAWPAVKGQVDGNVNVTERQAGGRARVAGRQLAQRALGAKAAAPTRVHPRRQLQRERQSGATQQPAERASGAAGQEHLHDVWGVPRLPAPAARRLASCSRVHIVLQHADGWLRRPRGLPSCSASAAGPVLGRAPRCILWGTSGKPSAMALSRVPAAA